MNDFLQNMASLSAERAASADTRRQSAVGPAIPLQLGQFDVIAEIKDRSPADGALGSAAISRADRARQYAAGGAVAISVLTEPSRFAGALEHLEEVALAVPDTPVMRKDFLVEPAQIVEARLAGASGVLLIATMLGDAKLVDMLACAFEQDMFVLLESFDKDDLQRSAALFERPVYRDRIERGQLLAGINTRNLRTLEVDANRLADLAAFLPHAKCVAESGLRTAADAAEAAAAGYHLALVGSALMQSEDPAALITAMRAAGTGRIAA